ncbi:MAG: YqeG family HAD IIIA-type phosphatase [Clostridia bacterium]|nr:YqeG family HAD IIIA-type phosphatase [Clostridia bacterium]
MTLVPDRIFDTYRDITPEFLASEGIEALLIDIDNTLAPYEQPLPDEHHAAWFRAMADAGVCCALISNNKPERVRIFSEGLGVAAYADCGKPSRKYLKIALSDLGVEASRAAVLGDQLLTDCLSARRMGMKAYIVPPIKDKTTLFFRFKRALERPFIKKYHRLHRKDEK